MHTLITFTNHINLHISGSVKTITMSANNQDVSNWILILAEHRTTSGSGSAAQEDDIEPEEDEVKMSEL